MINRSQCECECHTNPRIMHCIPCCEPDGTLYELSDEKYEGVIFPDFKLEEASKSHTPVLTLTNNTQLTIDLTNTPDVERIEIISPLGETMVAQTHQSIELDGNKTCIVVTVKKE